MTKQSFAHDRAEGAQRLAEGEQAARGAAEPTRENLARSTVGSSPDAGTAATCTLSPITCRCGGTHRPLTTPPGVRLEPGQTEAQRRTRLLVGARSVGDANGAMIGKPPKCECGKGQRCLPCIERDQLTKAQDGSPRAVDREAVQTTGETGSS